MKTLILMAMVFNTLLPVQDAHAWGRYPGGDHPDYHPQWVRRDPVVVHNVYVDHRPQGCVGCGVGAAAVAGLIGGAILGAAIAGDSAPPPPPTTTTIVEQAPPQQYGPPIGTEVPVLPPGCANMNVNGGQLYQCGPVWYQPFFGGNGVYYTVVPAP